MRSEKWIEDHSKHLTKEFWNCDITIPIYINNKLKRTLGRYVYERKKGIVIPLYIELSGELINNASKEIIIHILKHEICHYILSLQTKNFLDGDIEFENELLRIGAPSTKMIEVKYITFCSNCKKEYRSKNNSKCKKLVLNYKTPCCKVSFCYRGIFYNLKKTNVD